MKKQNHQPKLAIEKRPERSITAEELERIEDLDRVQGGSVKPSARGCFRPGM